jgi:hypothetical protein
VTSSGAAGPGPDRTPSGRGLRHVWEEWRANPLDRFGVVLAFVVATIVVSALVDVGSSWRQSLIVTATSASALLAAVRAVGLRRVAKRGVALFVALLLLVNGVLALMETAGRVGTPPTHQAGLLWLALVLMVPVLVIRRIFAHTVVAMRTVIGAVTAYLQIAVGYSVMFQAIDAWTAVPFFGQPEPSTAYMYVSLTTISTLGLGDLSPHGSLARLALSSEAVLGQVFLVTVVAVVVSRFAEAHRRA